MNRQQYKEFCFTSQESLPEDLLRQLTSLLEKEPDYKNSVLGGRSALRRGHVEGVGSVIIKQYCRGGLLGKIVKKFYLRVGNTRPEGEYSLLKDVRNLGVLAPQPIAAISKGGLFYQGWLVMKELPSQLSLADYSVDHEDEVEKPMEALTSQIEYFN